MTDRPIWLRRLIRVIGRQQRRRLIRKAGPTLPVSISAWATPMCKHCGGYHGGEGGCLLTPNFKKEPNNG